MAATRKGITVSQARLLIDKGLVAVRTRSQKDANGHFHSGTLLALVGNKGEIKLAFHKGSELIPLRDVFPWRKGNLLRGCKNIDELDKIVGKDQEEEDSMYYVNYDRKNNLVWCGTIKGWTQHLSHANLYQSTARASQCISRIFNQEKWSDLFDKNDIVQIPYEEAEELLSTLFTKAPKQPHDKKSKTEEPQKEAAAQPKASVKQPANQPAVETKTDSSSTKTNRHDELIQRLLANKKEVHDAREMLLVAQSEFEATLMELQRIMGGETAQALAN